MIWKFFDDNHIIDGSTKIIKNHTSVILFFLILTSVIFSTNVFAQISITGANVTTDKSNIFFQNTISLTNMTVLNDGVFMKFNDASEARKYTFYRQTSTNPYNVKILLLNATHGNFTVTTTGLTDTKLNITGSQVSALLDNISTTVTWNGILNTINSGAAFAISLLSTDTTKPTFTSAALNEGTGVFTITFSETIDGTPSTNIIPTSLFIRETGASSGGVTLSASELTTSTDGTTISFTLTEANRQLVIAMTTPQLDIGASAVKDTSSNAILAADDKTITQTLDTVKPTFTAVRIGINTIRLTFSENVDVTTTNGTGYTLSTGTVTANTDPAGSSKIITLTTSGVTGTSAIPTVTYGAAAGTTVDTSANEVANAANAVASDGVLPTFTGVTGPGASQITITFSENVNSASDVSSQWTVAGYTVSSVATLDGTTNTMVITLSGTVTGTPNITYTSGDIVDTSSNKLATVTVTPPDGAGPRVVAARIISANTIVVEFDKDVTSMITQYSGVTVNGNAKTISNHTTNGKYVTLTTSVSDMVSGQTGQMDISAALLSTQNIAFDTAANHIPIINNLGSAPVTLSSTQPTLPITITDSPVTSILINSGVDAKLDLTVLPNKSTLSSVTNVTTNNAIDVTLASGTADEIKILFPANLVISGPSTSFTGLVDLPETKTSGNCPPSFLGTESVVSCVEMGVYGVELTFNQPVKITLPGEGAYTPYHGVTPTSLRTTITTQCTANDFTAVSGQIRSGGSVRECYFVSGSDMIIWTTHFTSYGTTSTTSTSTSTTTSGGSGGGWGRTGVGPGGTGGVTGFGGRLEGLPILYTVSWTTDGLERYLTIVTGLDQSLGVKIRGADSGLVKAHLVSQTDKTMTFESTLPKLDDAIVVYAEIIVDRDAYVINRLISINDDSGTVVINKLNTLNPNPQNPDTESEVTDGTKMVQPHTPINTTIVDSVVTPQILSDFMKHITLKDKQSESVISDYVVTSSNPDMFAKKINNIDNQISTTIGYISDGVVVAILEIHSTDDTINSMTAINTGYYKTIELSNDGHATLLESDKSLDFIPFNTNNIKMMNSGIGLKPSIIAPEIVTDTLSHMLIRNINTNSDLIHYGVISVSEYSGVFKTLVGFPDRFNTPESNDEVNVILLFTSTESGIQSIEAHQIGSDDISISLLGNEPIPVKKGNQIKPYLSK